jgi:hypothetical protein
MGKEMESDGQVGVHWGPLEHPATPRLKCRPVRVDGKQPLSKGEIFALCGVGVAIFAMLYCAFVGSVVIAAKLGPMLESILGK